ncbi:Dna-directed rna polymerase i subunit rpa49-like protein [Gryllus bimaculatus]|nr:Dna-directed rna polymerase i subunit rpa49-like protein [Gryllus bimaculatus]
MWTMNEGQSVISEIVLKDGNVPPIIGHFENGDLKPSAGSVQRCGIFRKNTESDKYIVAVHTSDNGVYMGTQPEEEPYRTLLAVQDKGSNEIRLIEVDKVSFKPMSIISSTNNQEEASVSALYKSFGSRVIKRKTEQKERMTINIETFSERLHGTASNIDVDNALNLIDDSEYIGTFLPCNRNATVVTNVYNLEDIISPHELEDLQEQALVVLSNSNEDNKNELSSPPLRSKALCHLIVAGLLACKFTLNIEALPSLTQMSGENLMKLCRILGAVPMGKEKKDIVLKVPLPFTRKPNILKRKKKS